MKNIIFIILLWPALSTGQELSFLSFKVNPVQQTVQVIWQVAAGNSCQDIEIQHSLNGKDFNTFYTYSGVCGDPNLELSYDYTHQAPVTNQINYYRLKINQDITEIKSVFISNPNAITVLPHPVKETSRIIFSGQGNSTQVTIYSLNGEIVWQQNYNQQPLEISSENFKSGFHILQVSNQEKVLTKKILIL